MDINSLLNKAEEIVDRQQNTFSGRIISYTPGGQARVRLLNGLQVTAQAGNMAVEAGQDCIVMETASGEYFVLGEQNREVLSENIVIHRRERFTEEEEPEGKISVVYSTSLGNSDRVYVAGDRRVPLLIETNIPKELPACQDPTQPDDDDIVLGIWWDSDLLANIPWQYDPYWICSPETDIYTYSPIDNCPPTTSYIPKPKLPGQNSGYFEGGFNNGYMYFQENGQLSTIYCDSGQDAGPRVWAVTLVGFRSSLFQLTFKWGYDFDEFNPMPNCSAQVASRTFRLGDGIPSIPTFEDNPKNTNISETSWVFMGHTGSASCIAQGFPPDRPNRTNQFEILASSDYRNLYVTIKQNPDDCGGSGQLLDVKYYKITGGVITKSDTPFSGDWRYQTNSPCYVDYKNTANINIQRRKVHVGEFENPEELITNLFLSDKRGLIKTKNLQVDCSLPDGEGTPFNGDVIIRKINNINTASNVQFVASIRN